MDEQDCGRTVDIRRRLRAGEPVICRGHFAAAFVAPDGDHSAVSMGE